MKNNTKKGKNTMIITITIACFCLTLVMFMQFKIVNQTDITSIENMREEELREEYANWKTKYDEINQKYAETQNKLSEYKQNEESNVESEKLLEEELNHINLMLGKTDVEGPGIEIILRDTETEKINEEDILLIMNALKLAGAEAIEINNQRIVNMTDIVGIPVEDSSRMIRVNSQRILSPYIIKAIGDPKYLESSLLGNGGEVDKLKKEEKDISINQLQKTKIQKYTGEIKSKYINE